MTNFLGSKLIHRYEFTVLGDFSTQNIKVWSGVSNTRSVCGFQKSKPKTTLSFTRSFKNNIKIIRRTLYF